MMNWLFGRSRDRTADVPPPAEPDPQAERDIFVFHDGTGWRRADPIAVGRRIEDACPGFEDHLRTLATQTKDLPPGPVRDDLKAGQRRATQELVKATRAAFGVRELTEAEGLTEAETVALLTAFLNWMAAAAGDARPH